MRCRTSVTLLAASALFAASVAVALATRPPMPVDETRVLAVAWEMWNRGDYLVPHLNGAPYSHKPPLLYWAINLAWGLAGVHETVARIVPALFALAGLGLVTVLAGLIWPSREAARGYAAIVLAGTGAYALFGGVVLFDAAVAATTLLGLAGVALVWRRDDRRGWALFGLGLGLGLLTKGPVAFVHLLPVPLLAPLWQQAQRVTSWRRWYVGLAAGIGAGAAIALAWAIPAAAAGGDEYRRAILWGQTAGRVVGSFAHREPPWFYLAVLPALLFPWWLWPPLWRAAGREMRLPPDDGLRLVLVWLAVVVAVMSIVSGKQAHYLVPLLPAFALLAARLLDAEPPALRSVDLLLPALVPILAGVVVLLVPAAAVAAPRFTSRPLPAWLARTDPAAGAALVVGTAALAIATTRVRSLAGAAFGVAAGTLLLFGVAHVEWSRLAAHRFDLRPLATDLGARQADGLAMAGAYAGEFGFLGRLTVPVDVIAAGAAPAWLAAHPAGHVVLRYRDSSERLPWPPIVERPYRGGALGVWGAR